MNSKKNGYGSYMDNMKDYAPGDPRGYGYFCFVCGQRMMAGEKTVLQHTCDCVQPTVVTSEENKDAK